MTSSTAAEARIPGPPPIPGLVFRPFDPERDYPAIVELMTECHLADEVDWLPTVENLRVDFENTFEFDPRRDVLLAEVDGMLVAASDRSFSIRDGEPIHHTDGWVRPAWRRRGLGRALLGWAEDEARRFAAARGDDRAHAISAWPDEHHVGAIALYEGAGYKIVRYGFMMVRDLADPIAEASLPEGLEIRPVRPEDHRRIWDADIEAFRDHWGARERTEEDYTRWFAMPELDTSLWRVAWDGDEVAGSVMTFIYPEENERLGVDRGWLEHISVRRPWRRRGLASALIGQSLVVLRDAGLAEAALGVDAENISGALRVYEAAGFRRHRTGISYQKTL